MKYKIETDDVVEALNQFAEAWALDEALPDTAKLQCTLLEPGGVRVTIERLSDDRVAREAAARAKRREKRKDLLTKLGTLADK